MVPCARRVRSRSLGRRRSQRLPSACGTEPEAYSSSAGSRMLNISTIVRLRVRQRGQYLVASQGTFAVIVRPQRGQFRHDSPRGASALCPSITRLVQSDSGREAAQRELAAAPGTWRRTRLRDPRRSPQARPSTRARRASHRVPRTPLPTPAFLPPQRDAHPAQANRGNNRPPTPSDSPSSRSLARRRLPQGSRLNNGDWHVFRAAV